MKFNLTFGTNRYRGYGYGYDAGDGYGHGNDAGDGNGYGNGNGYSYGNGDGHSTGFADHNDHIHPRASADPDLRVAIRTAALQPLLHLEARQ